MVRGQIPLKHEGNIPAIICIEMVRTEIAERGKAGPERPIQKAGGVAAGRGQKGQAGRSLIVEEGG